MYLAMVKFHDPDDICEQECASWAEAQEWLAKQAAYGWCTMWVNGDHVEFIGGHLVNVQDRYEPAKPVLKQSPFEAVFEGLARANMDFDRIFGRRS